MTQEENRRELLRRAAIGLPVILATVQGRKLWAQGPVQVSGGTASAPPSQ